MSVCCLNCGTYFDEIDEFISPNQNFCSDECKKEFIEYQDKEMEELMEGRDGI